MLAALVLGLGRAVVLLPGFLLGGTTAAASRQPAVVFCSLVLLGAALWAFGVRRPRRPPSAAMHEATLRRMAREWDVCSAEEQHEVRSGGGGGGGLIT